MTSAMIHLSGPAYAAPRTLNQFMRCIAPIVLDAASHHGWHVRQIYRTLNRKSCYIKLQHEADRRRMTVRISDHRPVLDRPDLFSIERGCDAAMQLARALSAIAAGRTFEAV